MDDPSLNLDRFRKKSPASGEPEPRPKDDTETLLETWLPWVWVVALLVVGGFSYKAFFVPTLPHKPSASRCQQVGAS
jgi:hypothetical protein